MARRLTEQAAPSDIAHQIQIDRQESTTSTAIASVDPRAFTIVQSSARPVIQTRATLRRKIP
jgi:hypothetical protein